MSDIYGYKVKGTKIENLYSIEGAERISKSLCLSLAQKYSRSSKEYYKNILLRNYSFYYNFIEHEAILLYQEVSKISPAEKLIIKNSINKHIKLIKKFKKYLIKYGNDIVKKSFSNFSLK